MADIMSYHYPASSSSGSVDYGSHPSLSSHPHNGYNHLSAEYSGSPSPHAMSQSVMQTQDHGDHNAIGGLNGEKRRNKLGYHRTSVACGHCRRRKIRCIPSPNDLQGRCINCIRLKKDCSFYPVDQQPPLDTRKNSRSSVGHLFSSSQSAHSAQSQLQSQTKSQTQPAPVQKPLPPPMASLKTETNGNTMPPPPLPGRSSSFSLPSSSVSVSPSPSFSDAQIVPSHFKVQDTRQNPQLTMPSIQTMAPPMKEPYSPDKLSGRHSFDYGTGLTNWMSADASPNPSKPSEMGWRYDTPITPSFPAPAYTTHSPANWTPQSESAGSRTGEDLWSYSQPPPRSLSFSSDTMSTGGHHTQQSYPSISQMARGAHHSGGSVSGGSSYDRKSSSAALSDNLYNSSASTATTTAGVDSIGTTLDHHASLSAGSAYPGWSSGGYPYGKDAAEPYVSWADASPPASEAHAAQSMYYAR